MQARAFQGGKLPGEVTVDVPQDLHEVGVHRGEGHAGRLPHVDGALLRQVHVVEVDELELRLLVWPEGRQDANRMGEDRMCCTNTIVFYMMLSKQTAQPLDLLHGHK